MINVFLLYFHWLQCILIKFRYNIYTDGKLTCLFFKLIMWLLTSVSCVLFHKSDVLRCSSGIKGTFGGAFTLDFNQWHNPIQTAMSWWGEMLLWTTGISRHFHSTFLQFTSSALGDSLMNDASISTVRVKFKTTCRSHCRRQPIRYERSIFVSQLTATVYATKKRCRKNIFPFASTGSLTVEKIYTHRRFVSCTEIVKESTLGLCTIFPLLQTDCVFTLASVETSYRNL